MAERQLVVKLIGDERDLKRSLTSSEKGVKRFEGSVVGTTTSVSRLFAAAGITVGAASFTRALGESIAAASNLTEQISKSRQVFGQSSTEIEAWSKTTAESMGISQAAALEATGTFGNLFNTVGLIPSVAAPMSQALVQLAADLASFNNASPEDVLVAIRSGLIGEAEPLRRYGVLLSETRVQQQAMANTGKDNVKALTDQEKALARYQIILSDTTKAQGDFARTQGTLANQSRILRANLNDLSAQMGAKLLPILTDASIIANELLERLGDLGDFQFEVDVAPGQGTKGFDFSLTEGIKWVGGWKLIELAVEKIADDLTKDAQNINDALASAAARPERGGTGGVELDRIAADERKRLAALAQAEATRKTTQKRFSAFVKGIGLALDQADLTDTLSDNIRILGVLERAILRQIEEEGRTFELVDRLTQTRLQKSALIEQQAEAAKQRQRDAIQAAIDLREERAEAARLARENARQARQTAQFLELGLTAEGGPRGPSTGALRRRLRSLREQVKGTPLDTEQTQSQLRRIAKVLSGAYGKVGRDVRQAILGMFNEITGAFDQGDKQFTEFEKTSVNRLTAGLGLTREQREGLRGQLAATGMGGVTPAQSVFGAQDGPVVVTGDVHVNVTSQDPDAVMRAVQNTVRKRAAARTGRRRGSRSGFH